MKNFVMLRHGKEHHLVPFLGMLCFLGLYLEEEYIMKLSNMRKKETLDLYLLLDIQQ